jgi:hypothetical protein
LAPKPFDPNTAPVVGMTADERAAVQKQMNDLALRLRDATGIVLYEYKIHDLVPYWNPFGFDFKAAGWRELLKAANETKGLGNDPINMPGADMWLRGNILSEGFTQIGKPPHVHLDIATNRPGQCRLYMLNDGTTRRLDTLRRAEIISERQSKVFKKIYERMEGLGIDLDQHIGSNLEAGRLVLDGINFVAKDHIRLIDALSNLKYPAGDNVFFRGAKSARHHFAGNASFLATDGIGFRQIWQTYPTERPMGPNAPNSPAMDPKASARFGDSQNLPDLTSVHCAVSKRMCNVHIDEMGFVITDAKGTIIVDPDALRHIFVELLWKTDLQGKLPFWALDDINFVIPSSPNEFSRVGVSIDVAQFGRVNIALNGSCSTDGKMETSGTLTLGFKF